MSDTVVIFGSYNKGPEYKEKLERVSELRREGLDVHLFYLLALTYDDRLPDQWVDALIVRNIETAIAKFKPTVLAFHNGLTLHLKNKEFKIAIEKVTLKYPDITFLIEYLNHPDNGSNFNRIYGFLEWSQQHFTETHDLYDILWKQKTS